MAESELTRPCGSCRGTGKVPLADWITVVYDNLKKANAGPDGIGARQLHEALPTRVRRWLSLSMAHNALADLHSRGLAERFKVGGIRGYRWCIPAELGRRAG